MASGQKYYQFAEFALNPIKRQLLQKNTKIPINDKDFEVLLLLVENAPQIYSHDEIINAVWNGIEVTNNSVEKIIVNLRKALKDDTKKPQFIKTVRNRGYCFIYDVQEIEIQKEIAVRETFQPENPQIDTLPPSVKILAKKLPTVFIASVILLFVSGLLWWKGSEFLTRLTQTTVFADDFSENEVDSVHWLTMGKSVRIGNGTIKLSADETDKLGKLYSKYFTVDPSKTITIKSKIKITYSRNMKDETNFGGSFVIIQKIKNVDEKFLFENDKEATYKFFGVRYMNFDSRESYYDGDSGETLQDIPTEGFFLVKNGGRPNIKSDYTKAKISERIEPVWGQWFEQKIVYDPTNGQMSYFVNNQKRGEFNVGVLQAKDNQIRFEINPWGWWVNHSMEIDYIKVSQ